MGILALLKENKYKRFVKSLLTKYRKVTTEKEIKKLLSTINDGDHYTLSDCKVPNAFHFNSKLFKLELNLLTLNFNENQIDDYIRIIENKFLKKQNLIFKIAFSELKDNNTDIAVVYGMKYFDHNQNDLTFAKVLIARLKRVGKNDEILKIAKIALDYNVDQDLELLVFTDEIQKGILQLSEYWERNERSSYEKYIANLEEQFKNKRYELYCLLQTFFSDKDYTKSEHYGLEALKLTHNEYIIKNLYDLHIKYGNLTKAQSVISKNITIPTLHTKQKNIKSLLDLYKNGFDLKLVDTSKNYSPSKGKILYLLHNSLPYNSGGYATRTHGILTGVANFGWNMNGVSRLGYPWDKMPNIVSKEQDTIDDIAYHRLLKEDIGLGKLPLKLYLEEYAKELLKFSKVEKPEIIHAASNYMNGIVGNYIAKCLGIKSIYEVRGLWEITRISRQPEWKDTEYYDLMVKMEVEAANGADVVLTLTEALKNELISRGIPAEKIVILPNGVTSDRFIPRGRDKNLEESLKLKGKVVIGYIGSVVEYEGLELLVQATRLLVDKGIINISVLIVGDGAVLEKIKQHVKESDLEEYFLFTGRVPHEEVENYYSLVDIAPFPRKGLPVTEMVSPLKPFEAMAMQKAVISSNVDALKEIVKDGYNGLTFEKDNVQDFTDKLENLIKSEELREKLGEQARKWVIEHRDWKILAKKLNTVYTRLSNDKT